MMWTRTRDGETSVYVIGRGAGPRYPLIAMYVFGPNPEDFKVERLTANGQVSDLCTSEADVRL